MARWNTPALPRARLPGGNRQHPEPGPRAPRCGPARSGHARSAAGWGWEPGAGAQRRRGRREGAAASTLPAASPTPGLPVPLGASTSSEGELVGGAEMWTPGRSRFYWNEAVSGGPPRGERCGQLHHGSLGQNSDGLARAPLHRGNGQSGDGQHDCVQGTPAGTLDVPPSVRSEEGASWPDSPKQPTTPNLPAECSGTSPPGTAETFFTFSPTPYTWKPPSKSYIPPHASSPATGS